MRTEKDSLGERSVPDGVYWGIQTERAIENFPISGLCFPPEMARAIGAVKRAAAETNAELGALDLEIGKVIAEAAGEVMQGKLDDQFREDVFQAGAGTSFNMNANEVIANRALEILGLDKGNYSRISPNDHVNMSQSTNDVFPTTMRIATLQMLERELYPSLSRLEDALHRKSKEFDSVVKSGRTHLQDAVPIRLGQEFGAYALAVHRASEAIKSAAGELVRVNIGATAVGTGINTPKGYQKTVVEKLAELTGLPLWPADNLVEITQSCADFSRVSGILRSLALELVRIANDIRLLSSGPRTGLGEINLPAVQPGSSIMPGKINPSIPEMMDMVGFQVAGNDLAIALAVQAGQLELNVMMPVIAHNLLQSVRILGNGTRIFSKKCVEGITANEKTARGYAEASAALVTVLSPRIGYLTAAEIVKESALTGRSIREIVLVRGLIPPDELEKLLDPFAMTGGQ